MTRKSEGPRNIPVNKKLLKPEDREALRAEARKSVLAEMAQDARDAYFKEALAEARREHTPVDRIVHVMVDVAPFIPHIMLDGIQYFHGYGYDVPQHTALVIYEQMQRSWHHQDEIDGRRKSDAYRRPQNRRIGPHDQGTVTRGFSDRVPVEAEL